MNRLAPALLMIVSTALVSVSGTMLVVGGNSSEIFLSEDARIGRDVTIAFARLTADAFDAAASQSQPEEMDTALANHAGVIGPLSMEPLQRRLESFADDDAEGPRKFLIEAAKGVRSVE